VIVGFGTIPAIITVVMTASNIATDMAMPARQHSGIRYAFWGFFIVGGSGWTIEISD